MLKKHVMRGMLILITALVLSGCEKKQETKHYKQRIVVAKKQASNSHLYYNGVIAPIKTISVTSPVEGRIATMDFHYGEQIIAGQELVTIDSQSLSEKFRSAISDYLTTKETLATQKLTFQGIEALYKAGIETRNSFINARSQYETAEMNYYQKRLALHKILEQVKIPEDQFESLSISDTDEVNKVLSRKFKKIPVKARGTGVALFPIKTDDTAGDDSNGQRLMVGSAVKEGQLILSIGDLSGLSVSFKVGEVDVNRLRPGLKVIVTGVSFPGERLTGVVSSVASQADDDSGSQAMSQFSVTVKIPNITEQQRRVVHIGMTSKVDIAIANPPRIMLPINAISQQGGQSVVTLLQKDGNKKQVPVTTGTTNMNQVTILSGVEPGQKVVVNDPV